MSGDAKEAGADAAFLAERPRLVAIAYRLLGERAAAEDVAQEAWLRWRDADHEQIRKPAAWLRSVATRIAIDALRSAHRRRETYVGPWLPEPLLTETAPPAEDAFILARECELALLWAMERLAPEERAAFILRDAFDAPIPEIAEALGKSEDACRQMISRARRRVRSSAPRFDAPAEQTTDLLARFAAAAAAGDAAEAISLLAPNVVAISDGGGKARAALRVLKGAAEVAQVTLSIAAKRSGAASASAVKLVQANARPALAVLEGGEADMVMTLAPDASGRVAWIYIMRNPSKLPATAP